MKAKRATAFFRDATLWLVGSVLFASSVNVFTLPGGYIQGGLTGVSLMLNRVFGTGVGAAILVLNIPLFVWAYRDAGRKYAFKTAAATLISSAVIDISQPFMPQYCSDRLLGAIFAGILSGAGLGLIYIGGASTGGSDLAGYLISRRKSGFSVGKMIFAIDAAICLAAVFVYKSLESGMYGLILTYVSGRFMDALLDGAGFSGGRVFFIITEYPDRLCREINGRAVRGVTVLNGSGFYSGRKKSVLMCAVRRHELSRMYSIIKETDVGAFIVVCPASDIRGMGFSR